MGIVVYALFPFLFFIHQSGHIRPLPGLEGLPVVTCNPLLLATWLGYRRLNRHPKLALFGAQGDCDTLPGVKSTPCRGRMSYLWEPTAIQHGDGVSKKNHPIVVGNFILVQGR